MVLRLVLIALLITSCSSTKSKDVRASSHGQDDYLKYKPTTQTIVYPKSLKRPSASPLYLLPTSFQYQPSNLAQSVDIYPPEKYFFQLEGTQFESNFQKRKVYLWFSDYNYFSSAKIYNFLLDYLNHSSRLPLDSLDFNARSIRTKIGTPFLLYDNLDYFVPYTFNVLQKGEISGIEFSIPSSFDATEQKLKNSLIRVLNDFSFYLTLKTGSPSSKDTQLLSPFSVLSDKSTLNIYSSLPPEKTFNTVLQSISEYAFETKDISKLALSFQANFHDSPGQQCQYVDTSFLKQNTAYQFIVRQYQSKTQILISTQKSSLLSNEEMMTFAQLFSCLTQL